MKGHGAEFEMEEGEAIVALLTQPSAEHAARSIGVAPATLLRWMKDPEFDAAYREAKRKAFGQSIARLQQATSVAVTTLLKVMVDPSTPPNTKVRAADSIIDHAPRQSSERHGRAFG